MNNLKEDPVPETLPVPRSKIADSIFTNLFRIPGYALQLYQALHPEDRVTTEEEIRIVTLENVLLNQSYNDFGMVVRGRVEIAEEQEEAAKTVPEDKTLVLCEAQSTWSVNILVRILIYWAQTLKEHMVETKQNMYGSKKVRFPVPEFYVVYTGKRKTRPEMISLSREFGLENADLKVRMIYDGKEDDIIHQYVTFVKIYQEQFKLYGRTHKTIIETLRICVNRNVLKEYFESRKKEVVDIMMSLFDEEFLMEAYTKEIKDEGRKEGQIEGRKEGQIEGEDKILTLMQKLFAAGRSEDAVKASNDKNFCKMLMKEYGLAE